MKTNNELNEMSIESILYEMAFILGKVDYKVSKVVTSEIEVTN